MFAALPLQQQQVGRALWQRTPTFLSAATPKFEETESRKFLFALNDVDLQKIPVEFHCCAHAAAVKAGFFAVGKRLDAPNSAPSF
jgi:hypothetical protein